MFVEDPPEFLRNSRHVWDENVVAFILFLIPEVSVFFLDLVVVCTKAQLKFPQALSTFSRCLCSFPWARAQYQIRGAEVLIIVVYVSAGGESQRASTGLLYTLKWRLLSSFPCISCFFHIAKR